MNERACARRSGWWLSLALVACACGSTTAADAGADGGLDAGTSPVLLTPTRVSGWEDRLFTYQVTSSVEGLASRQVTVLLPPGYGEAANADRRYPVLYMHDGQNCLDHDAFGHGGWQVHTVSTTLVTEGKMKPVLFVLVDNTSARAAEYVRFMGSAPGPTADGYLDFLERDVVPWVDRTWRTEASATGRGLGGSSYGGIISLDGAWRRTGTWGTAMSMSTAFGYDFTAYANTAGKLPVRVYLDSGTTDYSGGDDGRAQSDALVQLLQSQGWVKGTDLQHVIGQGDSHSENYWRGRLPGALSWLYPP